MKFIEFVAFILAILIYAGGPILFNFRKVWMVPLWYAVPFVGLIVFDEL